MPDSTIQARNWFEQGGAAYARFRPEYPAELAQFLSSVSPNTTLAVDVGCGSGQLSRHLATYFHKVIGLDSSADQIAHATAHPRIEYVCPPAERLPIPNQSVDLVTAAQAAHWFDLPRFYKEVRRIGVPHGIVALVSYGVMRLDNDLESRFTHFYWQEIGPYWPAERRHVDTGYFDLPFPFEEQTAPVLEIQTTWTLEALLGYLSTWSAVHNMRKDSREDILHRFVVDLTQLWGEPSRQRTVFWPINMRLGKL